jgi:hypothetical protein
MANSKPIRRKPLGHLIPYTDAELDQLSQVTPQDIERAKVWWKENAPRKYKNLLDAKPTDVKPGDNGNPL